MNLVGGNTYKLGADIEVTVYNYYFEYHRLRLDDIYDGSGHTMYNK